MADHEALLKILNARGKEFLNSFSLPEPSAKKRRITQESVSEDEYDAWDSANLDSDGTEDAFQSSDNDFSEGSENDDISEEPSGRAPVIVFSDSTHHERSDALFNKAQKKAFMSSKVSKLKDDPQQAAVGKKTDERGEDERSNIRNDIDLHRLVHTKLLSGSLNPDLFKSSGQRGKAISGRVLEVSGGARLGQGEKLVRTSERNKAAKRVRDGLIKKEHERAKQKLEEAKNLGNYHPLIKKQFDLPRSGSTIRKRSRGLGIGVGKFRGGMLKLSQKDVGVIQDGGRIRTQHRGKHGHKPRRSR